MRNQMLLQPNMMPFHWVNQTDKIRAIQKATKFIDSTYSWQFNLIQRIDANVISGIISNIATYPKSLDSIDRVHCFFIDYENRSPVYITFDNISLYILTEIHHTVPLTFFFKKIDNPPPISKNTSFMIMPFKFQDLNDLYKIHIRDFLKQELNIQIFRADDFSGNDIIIETIYKQIEQAEIIIAEITHSNKNVFYELGYSYALKKEILMLQNKTVKTDSFFDKQHIRTQRYDPADIVQFKAELKANITAIKAKTLD